MTFYFIFYLLNYPCLVKKKSVKMFYFERQKYQFYHQLLSLLLFLTLDLCLSLEHKIFLQHKFILKVFYVLGELVAN